MRARTQTPVAKALITLGVVALYIIARNIPLSTIIGHAGVNYGARGDQSIMALGFQPLLSGYLLVECAALLVPKWRPLRAGSQEGRAQLHRASLFLGMILSLGQGIFLALAFKKGSGFMSFVGAVIIFQGATAALIVLTWLVDREGLGGGFAALLLAAAILGISGPIGNALTAVRLETIPFSALFTETLGLAGLLLIALFLFSPYCLPNTEPHALMIGRPACGLAPLTEVPQILMLGALFQRQIQAGRAFTHGLFTNPFVVFFACLIGAFVFAFLFNRPGRIAALWNALSPNPPEGIPRLKPVLLESILFFAFAYGLQEWLIDRVGQYRVPMAATVILATGIICDLVREWRARQAAAHLIPIWEIHQTYATAPAMRLLETQGLHPFARGLHLHSLLQFFGPYAPIRIVVPSDEAQTGHALLQSRWPSAHVSLQSNKPMTETSNH